MEPFIVCENLVKIYMIEDEEVLALQGLDLIVGRGEFMAIVGASGSGKSTLLNVLGGLDLPTAGRATVGGRNLLRMSQSELNRYRRSEVGFVWQQTSRNLIPYLTAVENVELPMILAGTPTREVRAWSRELLERVSLKDRMRHRLAQLSGGEQQRVAIAVALANRPTLVLADEPTGELDTGTARLILETFRDLNETYGVTTIIVTHDQQTAAFVERVVQIRDGKTSTERIRRAAAAADQPLRDAANEAEREAAHAHEYNEYVVLDSAGRLQLPAEFRERLNIGDRVEMDLRDDGVLIKPVSGRGLEQSTPTGQSDDEGDKARTGRRRRRPG